MSEYATKDELEIIQAQVNELAGLTARLTTSEDIDRVVDSYERTASTSAEALEILSDRMDSMNARLNNLATRFNRFSLMIASGEVI